LLVQYCIDLYRREGDRCPSSTCLSASSECRCVWGTWGAAGRQHTTFLRGSSPAAASLVSQWDTRNSDWASSEPFSWECLDVPSRSRCLPGRLSLFAPTSQAAFTPTSRDESLGTGRPPRRLGYFAIRAPILTAIRAALLRYSDR
jgi:hypothetical protein